MEKRTYSINFFTTKEERDRIRLQAHEYGVSVSSMIRIQSQKWALKDGE